MQDRARRFGVARDSAAAVRAAGSRLRAPGRPGPAAYRRPRLAVQRLLAVIERG